MAKNWGARISKDEEIKIGSGCIGICQVALGKTSLLSYPERSPEAKCWAGPLGRLKAEEEARRCAMSKPGVVWSKRGEWVDKKYADLKEGSEIDPQSIQGIGGSQKYDYVTKLGNFYLDANEHILKNPKLHHYGLENLAYDKPDMIQICRKPIPRGGYIAEIWCNECCPGEEKQ